ncbi:MAG: hypothetical protein KGO53_14635 [Alphaproteobacteria bacterium]|nr:hypothetical protein [Alphaproteobacteria bacterium]
MRLTLALMGMAVWAGSALADAKLYSNAKYGFSITVPPAIAEGWEEPDAGDGLRSHSADGKADFVVWAGFLMDENGAKVKFATEIKGRLESETGSGAKITYQKVEKKWAAFSSLNGETILYERAILSCKGGAIAAYRLQYPKAQKAAYDAVIEALNGSFIDNQGCELKN